MSVKCSVEGGSDGQGKLGLMTSEDLEDDAYKVFKR